MIHHNPAAAATVVPLSSESQVLAAVDAWNPGAAPAFLQIFAAPAGEVELGTTTPSWQMPIPAQGGRDPVFPMATAGGRPVMEFEGGLSYAVTGSAGGADAPAAAVALSIAYV